MKNLIKNAVYWEGILTLGVALGVTIKIVGACGAGSDAAGRQHRRAA